MMALIKSSVPEGVSGVWKVERINLSAQDVQLTNMRALFQPGGRGYIPIGTYTRLMRDGEIIMSDTPDELRDLRNFVFIASGDILITGLGLGIMIENLLRKDTVSSVLVIEKSPDVIKLIYPHLRGQYSDKAEVINGDAFTYKTQRSFDFAWHDIWDNICGDNITEMSKLRRHYRKNMKSPKSQYCWCECECRKGR